MNMRNSLQNIQPIIGRLLATIFAITLLPAFNSSPALQAQQQQSRHYLYDYEMPPGEVGKRKILARQSMVGYFQPVQFKGPDGIQIDVFSEGSFQATTTQMTTAGLMVGHIYRLKVTNIPGHPGKELYPSVEVIGRLFPPQGQEVKFPIPVNLHIDDMQPALDGALVTRVIYLENPRTAIAEQRSPDDQPFFDVAKNEDPIRIAETMGRPMAILRIGSRIPDAEELNAFGFGTPPLIWFDIASTRQFGTPSPGLLDPTNVNPFQFELEDLPPGFEMDDDTGIHRDSAVRQVTYLEPIQEVQEGTPPPTPAKSVVGESIQEVAQDWSLNDGGVENNTGLTPNGLVQDIEPAVPSMEFSGDAFSSQGVPSHSVPSNVYQANDYFSQASPMFRLPPWPDEVLIDGGDRKLKAVVKDEGDVWKVHGLDSEDTIAHFDTLDGRRLTDASNRVEIYAPRFAAVRKVDFLGRTQYTNQVSRLDDEVATNSSTTTDFSSTTKQNLQPGRHRRLTSPIGIENQTRGLLADNRVEIRGCRGEFKTFENLRLMKTGYMDNREKGRLSIAIQRAIAWESDVSAQSTTDNLRVNVAKDVREAREAVHVKTEFGRPQLRLVKIASTNVARPGDFVDFTIRFDNVGGQTIGNVTILDNLTGRLEYIADSSECTVEGQFLTEPNEGGSEVLRWEITDPLKPGKGGVIRFRCRVR